MATRNILYGTTVASTGGINSLATSSSFLAGYEWFIIDNTTEKALDYAVELIPMVGTTPTINTEIRAYAFGVVEATYPDVFDGTPSAETVTSAGVRNSFMKLVGTADVDATTSDRAYPIQFNLSSFFPTMWAITGIFIAHNTGVNLNATAGNQKYSYRPIHDSI